MPELYPRNYERPPARVRNVESAKGRARLVAIAKMDEAEGSASPAPVEYGELVEAMQLAERRLTNDECCEVLDELKASRYPDPARTIVEAEML